MCFENEIYFSSVEGIEVSLPTTLANCLMKRCHHILVKYDWKNQRFST